MWLPGCTFLLFKVSCCLSPDIMRDSEVYFLNYLSYELKATFKNKEQFLSLKKTKTVFITLYSNVDSPLLFSPECVLRRLESPHKGDPTSPSQLGNQS